jgi:glycosyltransferase involved in cell wall biosynthesis
MSLKIMKKKTLISLIVPVFNEDKKTLDAFTAEIMKLHARLKKFDFETILIDDSSKFESRQIVKETCELNNWKAIFLSRNFGKEAAMRAGLEKSKGSAVVVLDVDLQDPVDLIPKMIEIWDLGTVPVVLAKRVNRDSDSFAKKFFANNFYKLINKISDVEIPVDVGDFRLMDRKVVNSALLLNERNVFMKGIWAWLGYPSVTLEFERPNRTSGDTKFSFIRLFKIAVDGIASFSSLPIRVWSLIGLVVASLNLLFLIYIVLMKLSGSDVDEGYASIVVISGFSLSMNLICFGLIGEYLSRVFVEVKARPHYIILEEIN